MKTSENNDDIITIIIIDIGCHFHSVLCFTTLTASENNTHKNVESLKHVDSF